MKRTVIILMLAGLVIPLSFTLSAAAPKKTPEPTHTEEPTRTPKKKNTRKPTRTPKQEKTRKPTRTPKQEKTRRPTRTPKQKKTRRPTPTVVATEETPTPVVVTTPVSTPELPPTATPEPPPTATPEPAPTATEVPTPVPTEVNTPYPTAVPTEWPTSPPVTSVPPTGVPTVLPSAAPPPGGVLSVLAPVFRIDAVTAENRGSQIYGYAVGEPIISPGGFYGQDFFETSQSCDSFKSFDGAYSPGARRANCPVSSSQVVRIHNGSIVYGSARSAGTIDTAPPFGGEVCADFDNHCPKKGETCEGADCRIPQIEEYKSWSTYCPSNQGVLDVTASMTLVSPGDDPSQRCWSRISIAKDAVLSLTSTDHPYFIETLQIADGGFLRAVPSPANGYISVFVNVIDEKKTGSGLSNENNKPCQLHVVYLGTSDLAVDASADLALRLTAPFAGVSLRTKFEYFGAIRAKQLTVSNLTGIHYDESCNDRVLTGMKFSVRKQGEIYR